MTTPNDLPLPVVDEAELKKAIRSIEKHICPEVAEILRAYPRALARIAMYEKGEGLLDPDMPAQEVRLHMGEMTAQEERTARAAIRWANSRALAEIERLKDKLQGICQDWFTPCYGCEGSGEGVAGTVCVVCDGPGAITLPKYVAALLNDKEQQKEEIARLQARVKELDRRSGIAEGWLWEIPEETRRMLGIDMSILDKQPSEGEE